MENFSLDEILHGLMFDAKVQKTDVPTQLPFYIRGNSGRLWEVYELLPAEDDRKALWKGKARSVGNGPQVEDTLYVYQLVTMYGLFTKDGAQIAKGTEDADYSSPQEMFAQGGTSYEEFVKDMPHLAAPGDASPSNTTH